MDEQQSQKRGVRSEAQKEEKARNSYEPIPPANPVGGAFGERKRDTPTDEDVSLAANTNFHLPTSTSRAAKTKTHDE